MAHYSIREIERISGIKAHTLRIWEKRYHVVEPKRTETNIRYYDDDDLKKILNIAHLHRSGHRISQIACLDSEELKTKIRMLTDNQHQDSASKIDDLTLSMIEMDEKKFEKIFSTCVVQSGFENSIRNIVFPFLEKVGMLWQSGSVNPAQEHFITNLVRQKIIVAIDGLVDRSDQKTKHFLLFLPEGEFHELGLLFIFYLLKKRAYKVTYLGQSVPYKDIDKIGMQLDPDFIVTSFHTSLSGNEVNSYLKTLSDRFKKAGILFSNSDRNFVYTLKNERINFIKTADLFIDLLGNL